MFHFLKSYALPDTFPSNAKDRRDLECVEMGQELPFFAASVQLADGEIRWLLLAGPSALARAHEGLANGFKALAVYQLLPSFEDGIELSVVYTPQGKSHRPVIRVSLECAFKHNRRAIELARSFELGGFPQELSAIFRTSGNRSGDKRQQEHTQGKPKNHNFVVLAYFGIQNRPFLSSSRVSYQPRGETSGASTRIVANRSSKSYPRQLGLNMRALARVQFLYTLEFRRRMRSSVRLRTHFDLFIRRYLYVFRINFSQ